MLLLLNPRSRYRAFSEPPVVCFSKEKAGQAGDVAADKGKDVKGAAKDAAGSAQVRCKWKLQSDFLQGVLESGQRVPNFWRLVLPGIGFLGSSYRVQRSIFVQPFR